MQTIELKNICKSYNEQPVLNGIDLTVEKGDFLSVMGESGSGKSTLLSVMASIMPPDRGQVLYDGKDVYALRNAARAALRCHEIGIVYQFFNLIPTLNVRDNILLPVLLRKDDLKKAKRDLDELATYMKIDSVLSKYPQKISGGQQQRVAICRAMLYHPSFLFLDEPTGNLDGVNTKQVMELLRSLSVDKGVTVVQVTHSLAVAEYGNRIIHIKDGIILRDENLS